MPVNTFIGGWSKGFAGSPPNAAVVHAEMESNTVGKNKPTAIELTRPSYRNGVLTFTVDSISGRALHHQRLKNVTLFIDNERIMIAETLGML